MLNLRESSVSATSIKPGMRLLISSSDALALRQLQEICQRISGLEVNVRQVSNGHSDPLFGLDRKPDFLLLRVGHLWREELAALLQRPAHERPPLLVCGLLDDREGMRLAMQAGARDFLPEPIVATELIAALNRMVMETQTSSTATGKLIATADRPHHRVSAGAGGPGVRRGAAERQPPARRQFPGAHSAR